MAWITPVTDRTKADVDYAQMNRASPPTLKGALNFTDWARITGNIHFVSDLLSSLGYIVPVYCNTSWARGRFPSRAQVIDIYNDIERLQAGFLRYAHCPILSWNTYEKINLVERILLELHNAIQRMQATWFQSGEPQCGEV